MWLHISIKRMPLYINLLLHSSSFIFCLGTHSCFCFHTHSFILSPHFSHGGFISASQTKCDFCHCSSLHLEYLAHYGWFFSRFSCPSAQSVLQRGLPCQPKEEWAKYSLQTKYGPPPVFVDKVLLEYNHACSFTYCLSYNLEILTYKTYNT